MAKAFQPQVLTANDLAEGDSVWLGAGGWVRDIRAARVATTPEALAALEAEGAAAEAADLVVGVYAVAVETGEAGPVPVSRRERIRADRAPTFAYAPEAARIARAA